jgi:hypothetical protein
VPPASLLALQRGARRDSEVGCGPVIAAVGMSWDWACEVAEHCEVPRSGARCGRPDPGSWATPWWCGAGGRMQSLASAMGNQVTALEGT